MTASEALSRFSSDLREKLSQKASWGRVELKDLIFDIHMKLLNEIADQKEK